MVIIILKSIAVILFVYAFYTQSKFNKKITDKVEEIRVKVYSKLNSFDEQLTEIKHYISNNFKDVNHKISGYDYSFKVVDKKLNQLLEDYILLKHPSKFNFGEKIGDEIVINVNPLFKDDISFFYINTSEYISYKYDLLNVNTKQQRRIEQTDLINELTTNH